MRSEETQLPTLDDFRAQGAWLWVECESCCHNTEIPIPDKWPGGWTIYDARARLRCTRCNTLGCYARPERGTTPDMTVTLGMQGGHTPAR